MRSDRRRATALTLALLFVAAPGFGAAAQSVTTLEGTVASATATSVTVTTEQGQTIVTLTPTTRATRRLPAHVQDIKVGSFLAVTASKEPNGTLLASSVSILDAIRKIVPAGQFPMESGNIMTNATVTALVVKKAGRSVKMDYQQNSAFVYIPDDVAIRRVVPAKPSDLKAGQHVIVRGAAAGGQMTAASITIE